MTASASLDTMQYAETHRQLIIDNCALFKQVSREAIIIVTERLDSGEIIACAMLRANHPGRIVCSDPVGDAGSALRSLHDKTMRTVHGYRNTAKIVSDRLNRVGGRPVLSQTRVKSNHQPQKCQILGDAEDYGCCSETSEDPAGDFSDSEGQSDDEEDGDDETHIYTPDSSLKQYDGICSREAGRTAMPDTRVGTILPSLSVRQQLSDGLGKERKSFQPFYGAEAQPQPSRQHLPDASLALPTASAGKTHQQPAENGPAALRFVPKPDRLLQPPRLNHLGPGQHVTIRRKEEVHGSQSTLGPVTTASRSLHPFLQLTDLRATASNDFLITIHWKSRDQHRILQRCKPGVKAIQEAVLEFCAIHSNAFGHQQTGTISEQPGQHLGGEQDHGASMAPAPNSGLHISPNYSRLPWNGGLLRASLRSVSSGGSGGDIYDLANYRGDDLGSLCSMLSEAGGLPCVSVDVDFVRFAASTVSQTTMVMSQAKDRNPVFK